MLPAWVEAIEPAVLEATGASGLDALGAAVLRQWGSSEVWRLSYGLRSVIVKRGRHAQRGEGTAYERFVRPFGLPAPELLHQQRTDDAVLLVLTDAGRTTLEQEPSAAGYHAAVELLADIRAVEVPGPSDFGPDLVTDLASRLAEPGLEERIAGRFRPALAALHREAPARIVHGDFVGKNLVTDGTRWTAVDWPLAHLAPQLPDLYTLLREAVALGHDRDLLLTGYADHSGTDRELVEHQVLLGGCSFLLQAAVWVIEEGVHTVPASREWLTPLLTELNDLLDDLP